MRAVREQGGERRRPKKVAVVSAMSSRQEVLLQSSSVCQCSAVKTRWLFVSVPLLHEKDTFTSFHVS